MLRTRKNERERLTSLLDAEHPDVDSLAGAIFQETADMLLARDWWVLLAQQPGNPVMVYGPWSSQNQALKAVPTLQFTAGGTQVAVRKLATVGELADEVE